MARLLKIYDKKTGMIEKRGSKMTVFWVLLIIGCFKVIQAFCRASLDKTERQEKFREEIDEIMGRIRRKYP